MRRPRDSGEVMLGYVLRFTFGLMAFGLYLTLSSLHARSAETVAADPLLRMPGTQPGDGITLDRPDQCLSCHSDYSNAGSGEDLHQEPGLWQGSMMAQAARDPIFYACMVVAAQDSLWALGTPNATDLCMRCHFPKGWLEGRSDPPNASLMSDWDFDGVQCDLCHRMYDPFFADTYSGNREGADWLDYWDETNASGAPSETLAVTTLNADAAEASNVKLFNGNDFYDTDDLPAVIDYIENASGQYFVAASDNKRGPFTDAAVRHGMNYSRYHKSKYFCATCHDVSNPALANLEFADVAPGDGATVLPSEANPAFSYYHVERTFSEFMLSDFGAEDGAAGRGAYDPETFQTSRPGNLIASCQDCHMADIPGVACDKPDAILRPAGSTEHPKSGVPRHDLTGGNMWVPWLLASTVPGSSNFDQTNHDLLRQGSAALTLDLDQGLGLDPDQLLDGVQRAQANLQNAATIDEAHYNAENGGLTFRVRNDTGHKLISGFPEGRRMFINVQVYAHETLLHEINPYDATIGTLKGLSTTYSPESPVLEPHEAYVDELVYEVHPSSTLTGENETFHFVLADGRYKDNRIPPQGFDIDNAAARMSEPWWHGEAAPNLFTSDEYAGGYDEVVLTVPAGADRVAITLYYQTTSREYMAFLRDEINGTGTLTLPAEAYVAQSDAYFAQLKAWGDTMWQLWDHNKDVSGAAPVLMTTADAAILDGSEVHVDFDHAGREIGTESYPFNTLGEAIEFVTEGGTVEIERGATSETPTITKAMTLEGDDTGRVRIGRREPQASTGPRSPLRPRTDPAAAR